ncbi:hypothetical protein XENOCAPTIV_019531 [Xenoophorus captivus]|uniref:Uncharacterized protein n=1 Tax=Xenoophorus captivus TaxID=1517983 RepID=A0ABV0RZJ3_9TELE
MGPKAENIFKAFVFVDEADQENFSVLLRKYDDASFPKGTSSTSVPASIGDYSDLMRKLKCLSELFMTYNGLTMEITAKLFRATMFTSLGTASGFWQIPLHPESSR